MGIYSKWSLPLNIFMARKSKKDRLQGVSTVNPTQGSGDNRVLGAARKVTSKLEELNRTRKGWRRNLPVFKSN